MGIDSRSIETNVSYNNSITFRVKIVSSVENYGFVDATWITDLWSENQLADVNVLVGQNKLRVHRVVLSARSPVFNILLRKHGHTGKSKLTFDADEVEFSVVELFLKYLYTGTLSITTSIIGRNVQSGDTERDLSTGRSCSGFRGHYHFLHRIILSVATKLYVVTNFFVFNYCITKEIQRIAGSVIQRHLVICFLSFVPCYLSFLKRRETAALSALFSDRLVQTCKFIQFSFFF